MSGTEENNFQEKSFSKKLISWHKLHGRHNLPWQANKNPYEIWISEIMLQQTQVSTVLQYYEKFIKKYPTIKDLSSSRLENVLELWSGLGYYRRAEYIFKTSQIIKEKHNYIFPETYEELIQLPGVGKSTAGAILSLAYNKKFPILDGNVKRVIKRYFAIRGDQNNEKNLWEISEYLLPKKNNNIYTQSIMDLGSKICMKNNPLCEKCPIKLKCKSFELGLTNVIPEKIEKIKRKNKKLFFFLIQHPNDKNLILMKKNDNKGLWANLWSLPLFEKEKNYKEFLKNNQIESKKIIYLNFAHDLTHLKLDIIIYKVDAKMSNKFNNYNWKNIYDIIGVSKPIIKVIKKLKEDINNEKSNVLKIKKRA